ncbi:unnamed protein product [Amoebophrya sp. A25]|nr:unnamed protein product [Amoebophrya sp. A25]|eukprot:GSA25T00013661001.1
MYAPYAHSHFGGMTRGDAFPSSTWSAAASTHGRAASRVRSDGAALVATQQRTRYCRTLMSKVPHYPSHGRGGASADPVSAAAPETSVMAGTPICSGATPMNGAAQRAVPSHDASTPLTGAAGATPLAAAASTPRINFDAMSQRSLSVTARPFTPTAHQFVPSFSATTPAARSGSVSPVPGFLWDYSAGPSNYASPNNHGSTPSSCVVGNTGATASTNNVSLEEAEEGNPELATSGEGDDAISRFLRNTSKQCSSSAASSNNQSNTTGNNTTPSTSLVLNNSHEQKGNNLLVLSGGPSTPTGARVQQHLHHQETTDQRITAVNSGGSTCDLAASSSCARQGSATPATTGSASTTTSPSTGSEGDRPTLDQTLERTGSRARGASEDLEELFRPMMSSATQRNLS